MSIRQGVPIIGTARKRGAQDLSLLRVNPYVSATRATFHSLHGHAVSVALGHGGLGEGGVVERRLVRQVFP